MKNKNKDLSFLGGMFKSGKPTAVNGSRIFMLLFITVAFFFSPVAKAQVTNMYPQFTIKTNSIERIISNDNVVIISSPSGFEIIDGKIQPTGTNTCFFDTVSRKALPGPDELKNSSQLWLFDSKLFYIVDSTQIWSYDLGTKNSNLCFTANDRIINFWNMPGNRLLVNARSGGTTSVGEGPVPVSTTRLSIVNYNDGSVVNITDAPYIFQAFACGEKIVYLEGPKWFGPYPGQFKTTIYDPSTGETFSRSDFIANYLSIPVSDSTFLMRNEYAGPNIVSLVNVNDPRNIPGDTFFREDILDVGVAGWAPPVIPSGNNLLWSSIPYLPNREVQFSKIKNLKTGVVYEAPDEEVWVYNIDDFSVKNLGGFFDPELNKPVYSVFSLGDKYCQIMNNRFVVSKLYGKTTGVKNTTIVGLSVYPNPTSDGAINLTMPSAGKIEVYSITGQLRFSQNLEAGGTRVQNIAVLPGTSYIRVTIGNQSQTFTVLSQ